MTIPFVRTTTSWLLGLALLGGALPASADLIVHFHPGGRFADGTPPVSRWLRPDIALVKADAFAQAPRRTAAGTIEASDERAEMARWRAQPGVRLVEEDALGHFAELSAAAAPNDPLYSQQSWLTQVGATTLWALGTGKGVTVAVVDSGSDLSHPDLQANLLPGYNFGDGNGNPQDQLGHGTMVSGLIGAVGNNSVGVSGVAPGVKLLPLKINASNSGTFPSSAVAQAIDYAVAQGVQIINMSLTIDTDTDLVRQAIDRALAANVVVVAAAGNKGGVVEFPATMTGVVAVANVDGSDSLYSSSNRGAEIAIAAPGVQPMSTLLGGKYGWWGSGSGTSYSAPVISGILAVLKAANPHLSSAQLLGLLQQTAQPVSGYSFGSVRAGKAATALVPGLQPSLAQARGSDVLSVNYTLPPTGAAVDLYVAMTTPQGEFALRPDGGWQAVSTAGYTPLLRNYNAAASTTGALFGSTGAFAALPLAGLPGGSYQWRVGMVDSGTGALLGAISTASTVITP
jgi:subtilisin family serine protease